MASYATLPLEIRLNIYEQYLAGWLEAPGICILPSPIPFGWLRWIRWRKMRRLVLGTEQFQDAKTRLPVPAALQSELGEVRSHLLKWLARHRGLRPDKSAPVLRFPDKAYIPEHDFLYLGSPSQMENFSKTLEPIEATSFCSHFGLRIRRIALPASIRYTEHLPPFLKRLDILTGLEELAFAFVEFDRGELKLVESAPKNDPATYTLEQLSEGDIGDYRRKLSKSIEGLEAFIRPMLGNHARKLKITACKMIPRC